MFLEQNSNKYVTGEVGGVLLNFYVENFHRDSKDWYYSWVVPFGNFSGGQMNIAYNNIKVCKNAVLYITVTTDYRWILEEETYC